MGMRDELRFIPGREVWFVSAFVDAAALDPYARAEELGAQLQARIRAITPDDLKRLAYDPKLVAAAISMCRTITIRCVWHPYVDGFPFCDENTGLLFTKLGYFALDVTYLEDAPERRAEIDPLLVQQPPIFAAGVLRQLAAMKAHSALRLDLESPIFVFVISDEARPAAPPWTAEEIRRHRRAIGAWAEVYSGSWPDYSDELYESRIRGNLSNRLSEIHLIRRNSGFIYMAPDNLRRFFDGYMRSFVLQPTAELRAMHFAMMSIGESLDILQLRQARQDFTDLATIEDKLRNLQQLRAAIQMKMSAIYNELDSNRRQHYAAVLGHLLGEFALTRAGIPARMHEKFETLQAGLQALHQRQQSIDQERTERRLNTLNTLFSLGVLADFAALLLGAKGSIAEGDLFGAVIHAGFSTILLVVLALAIAARVQLRREARAAGPLIGADALVFDEAGRVLVITRKNPPCRGQRAFPGTLVLGRQTPEAALVREVKDETNLDIEIERPLGVYDSPRRDPRGRIVSHAFLCRVRPGPQELRCREDAGEGRFVPLAELHGEDLAFDHEDMLADARKLLGR